MSMSAERGSHPSVNIQSDAFNVHSRHEPKKGREQNHMCGQTTDILPVQGDHFITHVDAIASFGAAAAAVAVVRIRVRGCEYNVSVFVCLLDRSVHASIGHEAQATNQELLSVLYTGV